MCKPIMIFQTKTLLFVSCLVTSSYQIEDSLRAGRQLLDFRKMMKVFVRYNVKTNVVPYTSLFAFAVGFRGNWDIVPAKILHSLKRRLPQERIQKRPTSRSQYPAMQNQQAINDAVQRGFNLHGLNGTACLQRTLCEVSLINEDDIISRILKIVFNSSDGFNCADDLQCPFSFVDFIDHILTGSHIQL